MNPTTIIQAAKSEGVFLSLSATGNVKATGDDDAVSRWLPAIRQYKPEIMAELREAANDPPIPLANDDEASILAWLDLVGETVPVTIGEVIDRCRANVEARDYFIGRAVAELPSVSLTADDRRTCRQCTNLTYGGVCSVANPGGKVSANRGYRPAADRLQRCNAFKERTI